MRRILAVLFGVMLGGGLVFAAFEYHLVRTDKIVSSGAEKTSGIGRCVCRHPRLAGVQVEGTSVLAQNLIADGHGDLVGGSIAGGLLQRFIAPFQKNASESTQSWWNSGQK